MSILINKHESITFSEDQVNVYRRLIKRRTDDPTANDSCSLTVSVRYGQVKTSIIPSEVVISEFFSSFNSCNNCYDSNKALLVAHQLWDFLLTVLAIADFCGSMAKRLPAVEPSPIPIPLDIKDTLILWFQERANYLSILFSLGWFIDTLLGAHQRYLQSEQSREKEGMEVDHAWWHSKQSVYCRTIVIEILFLPSGLFVLLYDQFLKLNGMNGHHRAYLLSFEERNGNEPLRLFSSHFSISLISVFINHFLLLTMVQTRLNGVRKAKKILVYRLAHRAFWHPRRFYRRAQKLLRIIRWTQYLAPLLGTANKLKGNLDDLRKMRKQRRERHLAKSVRIKLWNYLSVNERRERAAVIIQKTFRAQRARKILLVLGVLKGQQETVAAIRLQKFLRAWLARARLQIKMRTLQLEELKRKRIIAQQKIQGVTTDGKEGRRLYLLQKELEVKARSLLREKLLLRPNTTFAVTWKTLFVVAVLFEISVLACQPMLSKCTDKQTGKPLDLETILDSKLIPKPVSKLFECGHREPLKMSIFHPVHSIQSLLHNIQQRRQFKRKQKKPWYCGKIYALMQASYINTAGFAIHKFLVLLGIICFLDVFITFFTGKYDENGTLVPKPFFERWIFPGLLLQLLVNPAMEEVCSLILLILDFSIHHDPVRVLRWSLVLFWPFSIYTFRHLRKLWYDFATVQNQQSTLNFTDKFSFQW